MIRFGDGFVLYTHAEHNIPPEELDTLERSIWPRYYLEFPFFQAHFSRLYSDYPDHQVGLYDTEGRLAAVGNNVACAFDGMFDDLADEGMQWALQKEMQDFAAGKPGNVMVAVSLTIAQTHLGKGLSRLMLERMRHIARCHNLDALVIPVRPSRKSRYPLISIDEYVSWKQPDGTPFDPWLRTHTRAGGRVLHVCYQSARFHATVAAWEDWTGLPMPGSGQYVIPGALNPLLVNREQDEGIYVEPNVWTLHQIEQRGA
jgi:GNAT superfamily N-acetyltransferase